MRKPIRIQVTGCDVDHDGDVGKAGHDKKDGKKDDKKDEHKKDDKKVIVVNDMYACSHGIVP
jgi:hypothetical protein